MHSLAHRSQACTELHRNTCLAGCLTSLARARGPPARPAARAPPRPRAPRPPRPAPGPLGPAPGPPGPPPPPRRAGHPMRAPLRWRGSMRARRRAATQRQRRGLRQGCTAPCPCPQLEHRQLSAHRRHRLRAVCQPQQHAAAASQAAKSITSLPCVSPWERNLQGPPAVLLHQQLPTRCFTQGLKPNHRLQQSNPSNQASTRTGHTKKKCNFMLSSKADDRAWTAPSSTAEQPGKRSARSAHRRTRAQPVTRSQHTRLSSRTPGGTAASAASVTPPQAARLSALHAHRAWG